MNAKNVIYGTENYFVKKRIKIKNIYKLYIEYKI